MKVIGFSWTETDAQQHDATLMLNKYDVHQHVSAHPGRFDLLVELVPCSLEVFLTSACLTARRGKQRRTQVGTVLNDEGAGREAE